LGYAHLDGGITDSSLWIEPPETRVVWITCLAKADANGLVACSRSGLQRAANVSEDGFNAAMESLEGPDPDSRTKIEEGRRIKRVDGGYQIINYEKYRDKQYSQTYAARKMRELRARKSAPEEPAL
jgi:hypothetical protein